MRAKRLWLFGAGAADVGQSRFFKDQTLPLWNPTSTERRTVWRCRYGRGSPDY